MIEWYKKYRIRKTISRKLCELRTYIKPGYNLMNTAKAIADIYARINELKEELK